MAADPEPLRYARRFLLLEEVLQAADQHEPAPEQTELSQTVPLAQEEINYDEELLIRN